MAAPRAGSAVPMSMVAGTKGVEASGPDCGVPGLEPSSERTPVRPAVVRVEAVDKILSPMASGVRENARPGCPVDDGRGHEQTFNDLSLRMANGQTSDLCSTILCCLAGAVVAKSSREASCGEDLADTLPPSVQRHGLAP
jgi:hypothetical protein